MSFNSACRRILLQFYFIIYFEVSIVNHASNQQHKHLTCEYLSMTTEPFARANNLFRFFSIFLLYQWWCLLANAKNDCKLIFSAIKNTHIKWNNSDLLLPRTVDRNYRAIKYKTNRFSSSLVCISNESVIVFLWILLTKIQLEIPIRSSVPVYRKKKCLPRWDKCNEYKLSNKSFGGIESFSGNELFLDAWLSKYDCTSDLGANKIERKTKSHGKFVQNDATWDSISNFVFLFITKQKWFDLNWGKNIPRKNGIQLSAGLSMCPSNCIDKECFCRCRKNRFKWKKYFVQYKKFVHVCSKLCKWCLQNISMSCIKIPNRF